MKTNDRPQRVAVFSKAHRLAPDVLRTLVRSIERYGSTVIPDQATAEALGRGDGRPRTEAVEQAQLVISVGGDGTLLATARAVGARETPILGINLGRLGFLTETTCPELGPVLDAVFAGRAAVVERQLLAARLDGDAIEPPLAALNDVTFSKKDLARLFSLSLFVDDEWVADYRADGLIIATPTGSTAYNLAAGGPIVTPEVDCLLATPICPHSLSQRPLILPGSARLTVSIADDDAATDVQITLDGQVGIALERGEKVFIERAPHRVRLIRPAGRTFFTTLRDKLGWGHP